MKYSESEKDRKLRKWFINDFTHTHLRRIKVHQGNIRGVSKLDLPIDFPLIGIAGKNGCGKSTILAIACCAYHNTKDGFKASNRRRPYYTFADFFIQHTEEVSPEGITIVFNFAHNNWRITSTNKDSTLIGTQIRRKKKGGKWSDYASRVERNCIFIGIERIVPHSEKSQSRSYKRRFLSTSPKGWENSVKEIVGRILNKDYEEFRLTSHSKYRLPLAKSSGISFSGFNMGAGENALFEIFSTIFSCPEGALFVIDEIELGLHIEAQKRFIDELKSVCLDRKIQIICTTHSKEIFECLPHDARFFIENNGNQTVAKMGVSAEYAFSKLSSEHTREVDVFVEDNIAQALLSAVIPSNIRARINIEYIGSATALCIQLAALHRRTNNSKSLIIYDGDQRTKEANNRNLTLRTSEKTDANFDNWFKSKTEYLPGDTWPELWIMQKCREHPDTLSMISSTEKNELVNIIDAGIRAGKHREFYEVAKLLGITIEHAIFMFCSSISITHRELFTNITSKILEKLNQ
ncbi:AAA family ATPase [Pseudomonas sp. RGM2987]|uniref:ATP-dependent nuclease n=1 Tax=Pseudomonas sp. RGM2987 TaxID=2930090 RepID=UPI001FD70912|nr:ATP-binding protein [Pseudomonas sp. RGM2987]